MTPILLISALLFLLVALICHRMGLFERDSTCFQELNWYFVLMLFSVLWALPSFLLLLLWNLALS